MQVQGIAGDGSAIIYSVAPTTGVANVNQVTNAIAASLSSTGDPAALTSGTSKSAADITSADGAFSAALVNLTNALGVTGSFITGTYNAAYDKLLDNVTIDARPNAGTSITTSAVMQNGSNDFLDGATVTTAYTTALLGKNTLPSGSDATNLPALSSSKTLAITDLETLRSKIEVCFALSASARGTVASPASACQGLDSPDGDYLHDGYYWLDTSAGCPGGNNTGVFCQGLSTLYPNCN